MELRDTFEMEEGGEEEDSQVPHSTWEPVYGEPDNGEPDYEEEDSLSSYYINNYHRYLIL